jgi:hypothetical protein
MMMKRLLVFLLMACFLFHEGGSVSAQNWFGNETRIVASKKTVTKNVKLHSFSSISIVGSGDIDLTVAPQGTAPQAKLIMPENLQDIVQVYVKDDVLNFRLKKGYSVSRNNTPLKLQLTAPMVKSVSIAGSGDFDILNDAEVDHDVELSITGSGDIDTHALTCDNLNVRIAGSGDVELGPVNSKLLSLSISGSGDIEAKSVKSREVEASIAGSGDIELKGTTSTARYKIAGSGDLKAHNLQACDVEASVAGSGDLTCYASESLVARTTGSGYIQYKGNPKKLEVSKRGVSKM